jgi:hypothetical protein
VVAGLFLALDASKLTELEQVMGCSGCQAKLPSFLQVYQVVCCFVSRCYGGTDFAQIVRVAYSGRSGVITELGSTWTC